LEIIDPVLSEDIFRWYVYYISCEWKITRFSMFNINCSVVSGFFFLRM